MYKLSIDLQSFQFSNGIIQANDTIRVSLTTLPEGRKQAISIDEKKLKNFHHFFSITITEQTEMILFVIRKKNFAQNDPIIASTTLKSSQFPRSVNDSNNKILKNINLYEPIQHTRSLTDKSHKKRKILGLMQLQFSLFHSNKIFEKNFALKARMNKVTRQQRYSKINSFDNNENKLIYLNSDYLLSN